MKIKSYKIIVVLFNRYIFCTAVTVPIIKYFSCCLLIKMGSLCHLRKYPLDTQNFQRKVQCIFLFAPGNVMLQGWKLFRRIGLELFHGSHIGTICIVYSEQRAGCLPHSAAMLHNAFAGCDASTAGEVGGTQITHRNTYCSV